MAQIQINLTYRMLERAIYVIIILLLLIFLINKFVSDDCGCTVEEKDSDTTPTEANDDDTTPETEAETTPTPDPDPEPEPDPDPEPEPEPNPTPSKSGKLEFGIGDIEYEIQESGFAKLENIELSINNGLDDDVKLFANIYLSESGNSDIEVQNPYWNDVEVPLIKSGEVKKVKLTSSRSYPTGVQQGDRVIIDARLSDFQGDINESATTTQELS